MKSLSLTTNTLFVRTLIVITILYVLFGIANINITAWTNNKNTPCKNGVASDTTKNQQDERARTVVGDMASSEVSLDALKSESNKRDGNSADTLRGCGRKNTRYSHVEHCWKDCGERFNSGMLILCKECSQKDTKTNKGGKNGKRNKES